jgi:hypothetical protein
MRDRPILISIVATFLFGATAIAAIVGISLITPGTLLDRIWKLNEPVHAEFQAFGSTAGAPLLLLGIVTGATAAGLLRGEPWARRVAIAVFAVNALGDGVTVFIRRDLLKSGLGALIAAAFLLALYRPNVISFFAAQAPQQNRP